MLLVNLNTRIINPAPAQPSLLWRWEQFRFGCDLFAAREPLTACCNDEQRRGWLSACSVEAEAMTPGYAQKVGW